LLAVLLRAPRRRWPAYLACGFVPNVVANSLTGDRLQLALALAFSNTVEVVLAGALIRMQNAGPFDLWKRTPFARFVLFGVGVAPAVSAILATSLISVLSANQSWSSTLRGWYISDALGIALVTPCAWTWQLGTLAALFKGKNLVPSAGVLGLLAAVTTLAFAQESPRLSFIIFPFLALVVFRLGLAGASLGVLVVSSISIGFTLFAPFGQTQWILLLYLATAVATTLPFALLLEERKTLERSLRDSELRYRRLFEAAKDGILILDAETEEVVDVNPCLCDLLGLSREEILGRKLGEIGSFKDVLASKVSFRQLQLSEHIRYENLPLETATGRAIAVEFVSNVYRVNGGEVIQCNVRDTTEYKQAAEAYAVLARAAEQAAESIVITDPQGTMVYVNPAFERISGYSRAEAIGQNPRILKSGQQDAAFYRRMWGILAHGEVWKGRMVNRHKDGTLLQEDATISPVRDASGQLVNYVAVNRDVTNETRLERQLMQAQKMEAVGRLAGGVAHDFNNLLGVILGYAETTRSKLPNNDPLKLRIDEILKATERAAGLTRQLLAFSRQQVLQPKILDLNSLVSNVEKMLRRLIGEDVELGTSLEPGLGNVKADPGQIEQVIMNLAVNARDAMPDGGRLTIETRNVEIGSDAAVGGIPMRAGSYVMLVMTDTGMGMGAETQSHLFEPFFTTKEMGKGTGLGLSTVYGIVKQSEGYIWCDSEVGVGTTFKVHLPRVDEEASPAPKPTAEQFAQGSETVLLIEDDPSLCDVVCEVLESADYTVLVAHDGAMAIQIADEYDGAIHLIVADVIMPGITGKQATDQIKAARSEVEILFISGYTGDIIGRHGVLSSEARFLGKPFTSADLLRKIREALDSRSGSRRP
jgi:PAS domain S-box-containing protein